ncbi:peroxiredoxin [Aquisediminimonas sediminicola]|uniref:peroxiredoxin n=1 Tax=Alteraquisediminimonas sediminicola TaxID=2676787 RepID=UPI001C8E7138|nr:peroxiredoxin [Aquisediminimonas sediminicola]
MANIGETAPDVAMTTIDGGNWRPSDAKGRKLVVYFYPKDDTPGCTTEAKDFSALADAYAAADVLVVGVSKDPPAKHAKFAAKHELKIQLVSDLDGSVCEAWGTWIEKSLYGRQYMGIDRATFLIDRDGRINQIWRKVKVKGHAEIVLEAAKALG